MSDFKTEAGELSIQLVSHTAFTTTIQRALARSYQDGERAGFKDAVELLKEYMPSDTSWAKLLFEKLEEQGRDLWG